MANPTLGVPVSQVYRSGIGEQGVGSRASCILKGNPFINPFLRRRAIFHFLNLPSIRQLVEMARDIVCLNRIRRIGEDGCLIYWNRWR